MLAYKEVPLATKYILLHKDNCEYDLRARCFFYIQESTGHNFYLIGHLPKVNPYHQQKKPRVLKIKSLDCIHIYLLIQTTLFNPALFPSSKITKDFK